MGAKEGLPEVYKTTRRVGNRPGPTSVAAKLQLLICTVLMVFIPKKQDNF